MHFNFVASDHFDTRVLDSVEDFVNHFPDFQTVWLTDENELRLLMELLGIDEFRVHEVKNSEFNKYWDLSNFKFPVMNEEQFDKFYENWIEKSNSENDMNNYGQLIFLQGLSEKWNSLKYRLVIKEGN